MEAVCAGGSSLLLREARSVFEDVGLPLHLKDCTRYRKVRLHPFQLIPPRQPTGIDGNLQQIVHLPSPEISVGEELQR